MKNYIFNIKAILFCCLILTVMSSEAQVAKTFNYQGVVLDSEGQAIANESISVNLKISGTSFDQSENTTTSDLGAFSINFDFGDDLAFDDNTSYFLESTITTSEGTVSSSSPLSYSPLALYALEAEKIKGIDILDESPTNEIQTLSVDGNVLSISGANGEVGNSVNLPSGGGTGDGDNDPNNEVQEISINQNGNQITLGLSLTGEEISFNVGDGDSDATNELQNWNNLPGIPSGIADGVDNVEDADSDPQNEMQDLIINGSQLSITGGNSITIPTGGMDADSDPENELQELVNLSDPGGTVQLGISGVSGNVDLTNAINTLPGFGGSVWNETSNDIYYNLGNVGIGTSTPSEKLAVEGLTKLDGITLGFTGGFQSVFAQPSTPIKINGQVFNNNGDVSLTNGIKVGDTNSSESGTIRYTTFTGGEFDYDDLQVRVGNTWYSLIFNNFGLTSNTSNNYIPKSETGGNFTNSEIYNSTVGNIGIGTSSPNVKLDVIGKIEATENIESAKDLRATDDVFADDDLFVGGEIRVGVSTTSNTYITSNGTNSIVISGDLLPIATNWDVGDNTAGEHWDDVTALDFITFSDERLKNNIQDLGPTLSKVLKLNPVKYQYKKTIAADNRNRIGFIAQDLQKIFPTIVIDEDVDTDASGKLIIKKSEHLSVNYTELLPILTSAIQEQQGIIEAQQKQIDNLHDQFQTIQEQLSELKK